MTKNLMMPKNSMLPEAPKPDVRDVTLAAEQQRARTEVEAAYLVAIKRPRDEDRSVNALEKAISRLGFAEDSYYSFPRGNKEVFGPSVNFAREFARVWGNFKYGFHVVHDDEEKRTIEAYAIDLEWNTSSTREASFKKLIQRKDPETGVTRWITPDERDLRELTSRHASIEMRNCILQLCPKDITDSMINQARLSVKSAMKHADIKEIREKAKAAFSEIGIYAEQLEGYLGHPVTEATPEEIAELRGILKAIKDGVATRDEYFRKPTTPKPRPTQPADGGLSLEQVLESPVAEEIPPETSGEVERQRSQPNIPDFLPPVTGGDNLTSKQKKNIDPALLDEIKCPKTNAIVRKLDCVKLCKVKNGCSVWQK